MLSIKPVKSRVLTYSNLENKNDVISICIKIRKTLATQGFLRAFQPSFSCNEKFTPKTSKMSPKTRRKLAEISHHPFFCSLKPHFLLSKNDFSFLESNNQTLVALSLKLIFTPFWHSAPKGGRSSPQILDFSGEKSPQIFPS